MSFVDGLFLELKKYNSDDIFVIGGEEVYTQLLPYCSEAHVTKLTVRILQTDIFPTSMKWKGGNWFVWASRRSLTISGITA